MITLYSYPQLFGLPDNNPFGLKVDTYLRLTQIDYSQKHIIDTKDAPRGQLPYLIDEDKIITESNAIISHLANNYKNLDSDLNTQQHHTHYLLNRMLDNHLYWIMSFSRWQDESNWPLFRAEFLHQVPQLVDKIDEIREYNIKKYFYQGIGRYSNDEVYNSGIADLDAINFLLADKPFIFGDTPHALDACCYGFLANILYFKIKTPLQDFIKETNLEPYVERIRCLLNY